MHRPSAVGESAVAARASSSRLGAHHAGRAHVWRVARRDGNRNIVVSWPRARRRSHRYRLRRARLVVGARLLDARPMERAAFGRTSERARLAQPGRHDAVDGIAVAHTSRRRFRRRSWPPGGRTARATARRTAFLFESNISWLERNHLYSRAEFGREGAAAHARWSSSAATRADEHRCVHAGIHAGLS